jgi:hypothetical protein
MRMIVHHGEPERPIGSTETILASSTIERVRPRATPARAIRSAIGLRFHGPRAADKTSPRAGKHAGRGRGAEKVQ